MYTGTWHRLIQRITKGTIDLQQKLVYPEDVIPLHLHRLHHPPLRPRFGSHLPLPLRHRRRLHDHETNRNTHVTEGGVVEESTRITPYCTTDWNRPLHDSFLIGEG